MVLLKHLYLFFPFNNFLSLHTLKEMKKKFKNVFFKQIYNNLCLLTFEMKQKIMYQPEFSYIKWNIVHISMCVFEWMKSPSPPFWCSETTTCIPIPPSQQSGDHLTSESVISHHVCHIKISHGETSRESKKYETQKTLPFLTVMYFLASSTGKVCPLFLRVFFLPFWRGGAHSHQITLERVQVP